MNETVIIVASFIPPILLVADVIASFFTRGNSAKAIPAGPVQFWLQDFFVLPLGFVAAMAWGFDRDHWTTALFPVLSVLLGFAAAADVCSGHRKFSALARAVIFAGIMAGFIVGIWVAATFWFLWKRFFARLAGSVYMDKTSRLFAAVATSIYAAAFFMPMNQNNAMGYDAYFVCCTFSPSRLEPGELPIMALAWTANPCFWLGIAFLLEGRRAAAAIMAIDAIALAFSICATDAFTLTNSPGYAVWFASMVALFLLVLAASFRRVRETMN